jgi:DNA-binding MltR family transcriptional regulator
MSDPDAGWVTIEKGLQDRGIDLKNLLQSTHAATALVISSLLEEYFRMAFEAAMANLSRHTLKKLLTGYGPLSTLSAKIDLACGMQLITGVMRSDANLIRGIRNKFAHSTNQLHFESHEIIQIAANMSTFGEEARNALTAYMKAVDIITTRLAEVVRRGMVVKELG